jgi:hypothetical protein
MKNFTLILSTLLILFTATSCQVIGDIFGAGFYTGIFVVVLIIVGIIALIIRFSRRK